MRYVEILRKIEDEGKHALQHYIEKFRNERVTIILFGSRARGDHNLNSDYDLLVVSDSPVEVRPHAVEPKLNASCFNIIAAELRSKVHENSVLVAALLEGRILLDNLNLDRNLRGLAEEIKKKGAKVTPETITFPRE